MNREALSLITIRQWLRHHQQRLAVGDAVPFMIDVAQRAAISRQTLYAILNERNTEFGTTAQIRLSRAIIAIDSESGAAKTNLCSIDLSGPSARLNVGYRPEIIPRATKPKPTPRPPKLVSGSHRSTTTTPDLQKQLFQLFANMPK